MPSIQPQALLEDQAVVTGDWEDVLRVKWQLGLHMVQ